MLKKENIGKYQVNLNIVKLCNKVFKFELVFFRF